MFNNFQGAKIQIYFSSYNFFCLNLFDFICKRKTRTFAPRKTNNMVDFGFSIAKNRSINLDNEDPTMVYQLNEIVPSFKRCINCGACSASCSAGQFTDFNIRKIHSMYRRAQYKGIAELLQKCMLCGKCTLVCPRGVNLRGMVINMRQLLSESNISQHE